jgi:hypothetical protein
LEIRVSNLITALFLIPAISKEPYWMAVNQPLPFFLQEYGRGWF